jgi:hypothetical protein
MARNTIRNLAVLASLAAMVGVASAQVTHPAPGQQPSEFTKGPAPKIIFDQSVLDLGNILDDAITERATSFRNAGEGDLIITSVHSTCGCTVGRIGRTEVSAEKMGNIREVVKPGESMELVVKFNPNGKRDAQSQRVTLTTNDPTQPQAVVEVRAFVEPVVRVEPMIVNLGETAKGEMQSQIVTVIGRTPDFEIERITINGADFVTGRVLSTSDVTSPDGRFERHIDVELIVDGTGKPQPVRGMVTIRTSDERRRLVSVQVMGTILGDLALEGESLRFGVVGPSLVYDRTVKLRTRSGKPFKIVSIEEVGSNNEFKSSWATAPADKGPQKEYQVKFTMPTNGRPGGFRGSYIVNTDVPDEEKIEIVYYGVVAADFR